ncbi:ATP-binding protein [Caballeronia sp. LZ062]|uniref:hybrid sensor histidine kinase/response regulator n=1 Tax=unclassified Caballeronia TaxID=2646786 RepID=UPI0028582F5B|nr:MULTISPECIES: ATP-binding protein [unclassified Caballeronia]MDR5856719.1 ATP-binding protein [Caballeronia sp. LZ050]MDR5869884.1 ATP-binding protein [Caballeronia sp. LZ062]
MNPTETGTFDLPLPSRNFSLTRRVLLLVLAASIVIPLACLGIYGYYDYQRRFADAGELTERLARVANEHAQKVLDLNQQLESRVVDMLGDSDDAGIKSREEALHRALDDMSGTLAQVAAISVFGASGTLLVNSRWYPAPQVSIAQRDDFLSARAVAPVAYFSLPLRGKVAQSDVFTTTMGRISHNGQFLGVVSIALKRDYFVDFYREIAAGDSALVIGLYRRDGGILVRYPPSPDASQAASNTPFTDAFRNNELFGRVRMTSTIDHVERVLAYRRVGDLPLYVATGYATSVVQARWQQNLALVAAIAALPCIAVWLLIGFSIRRLDAERAAWERWQAEVATRLSIEASSRQLRRMGALGNLVANVAHDFNNLLMVVSSNMALARRKHFNDVESEVLAVERATAGAESLARRLMSVARKHPLKQEVIDPAAWIRSMLDIAKRAVHPSVSLTVEFSADVWPVMADAVELELALVNLVANASEAMPHGGRIVIRCQNARLRGAETDLPDGEYVLISVTDNGEGMSEAVLRRAFEPLFTTKVRGAGTGLGLSQVLAACEQAGGTARITSVPGAGTTVRLYLPKHHGPVTAPIVVPVAEKAPCKPQPVSDDEHPMQGMSVLLVEDNSDVAAGVMAVLEVFGCTVHHEESADAAFALMGEGYSFDLVLSDVQMPGNMNGIDLAEQIMKRLPSQKLVLMTGYADEIERARHLGVPILAKPFDMDDLRDVIADGVPH